MVGAKKRKEFAADLRAIFATSSKQQALGMASSVAKKCREKSSPKVACHLEEHIEECLACLSFPEPHRRRTRTTNGLERFNQEIKRLQSGGEDLSEQGAYLRLVTALAVEQAEEWLPGGRYLDMEELRKHRRSEDCDAEQVILLGR